MRYRIVYEPTGVVVATFDTVAETRQFDESLTDKVWWDYVVEKIDEEDR
jgi:hypothetical protein